MSEHLIAEREMSAAAETVLALVARRAPGAEAIVRARFGSSALTRFANSRIHQNVVEDVVSVTLVVALGGRVAEASTTRTGADALEALVARALAAAALRPADPDFAGFAPPSAVPLVTHTDEATATATPSDRASIVAAFVDATRSPTRPDLSPSRAPAPSGCAEESGVPQVGGAVARAGVEAAGFCSTRVTTTVLASTTGQRAVGRVTAASLDGVVRASPDGLPASWTASGSPSSPSNSGSEIAGCPVTLKIAV